MKTPNANELLVEVTREAERKSILLLALECQTLEEFRRRLTALINSK